MSEVNSVVEGKNCKNNNTGDAKSKSTQVKYDRNNISWKFSSQSQVKSNIAEIWLKCTMPSRERIEKKNNISSQCQSSNKLVHTKAKITAIHEFIQ